MTCTADIFADLHNPDAPLVLYNVWDSATAKAAVEAGAKAVATGSWSLAAAHGYDDGQNIPFDLVKAVVARIVASVRVPVTVDFECGYGSTIDEISDNFAILIALGVVGINFEDQDMSGNGLIALEDQVQRIRALRGRANAAGVNVFINARTDLFLQEPDADRHADLVPSAIARGRAYMKAGASGVFVPGLQDSAAIRTIAEAIEGPLNILVPANEARVATLRNIGVSRFSYGPVPFLALMETFKTSANAAMSA